MSQMTRLGSPIVIGLLMIAGCSGSRAAPSASAPAQGQQTDAAAGPGPEGGATDLPSAAPTADASDAFDLAAGDREVGSLLPPDATSPSDARAHDTVAADAADDADADGAADAGGTADARDAAGGDPESGRLAGITAAHNVVRAAVQTRPALPPLVWNQAIADYAQQWASSLATSMCAQPQHRSAAELGAKGYGENLATFGESGTLRAGTMVSTAVQAVDTWAAEKSCWTFGTIQGSEICNLACYTNLHSDGCGHYTQIVWRGSTELGCGVATCNTGGFTEDIWVCNYAPAGNFIGRAPY